jgi:hypothetical protein
LRLERVRDGAGPVLLYPLLALLSFPTLGQLIAGEHGVAYAHDVFDLPLTGVSADWLLHGPTFWNSHLTSGNALLAQQYSPYTVQVALGLVAGPFAGYAIYAWLLAAVAGISMHVFLRDSLHLSTVATVGGAVIYLFGFWQVSYGLAAPALPLLVWVMDRAVTAGSGRWRFVLAGSLLGGFLLYHGVSQVVLLGAAVQLGFVIVTAPGLRQIPVRLATWAGTWMLALGLFGPVLVTQLVMLPISQRTIWDLDALYDSRPLVALADTIQRYSAAVLGVPVGGGWGTSPAVDGTYFLGALGLVLLVVGVAVARRDRRTAFLVLLLVAIPVVDLVAVLLTPYQEGLGFLRSFQVVRVRHLLPFALAALAALGLDVVAGALDGRRPPLSMSGRWRSGWRWAVVGVAAIPLTIALSTAMAQVVRRRRDLLSLETQAMGWALLLLALVIGLGLIVFLIVALVRRPGAGASPFGGLVVFVMLAALVGERVIYTHGERFAGGELGTWAEHLAPTSGQRFLLAQPGIDTERTLTFGDDANRMGAVGLLQLDGYQAIYPLSYHEYFGAVINPQLDVDPRWATYYRAWGNRAMTFGPMVDPELVALGGVRWLYVRGDTVPTVPGLIERFRDGDVTVYEVPDVLPRVFIAGALSVHRNRRELLDALATADRTALVATAYVVDGPDSGRLRAVQSGTGGAVGPAGAATITDYAPDRVEVAIRADRPGVLILTDVMAPGWVAVRDSTEVAIATVDGTFRGVPVDATTSTVVFRYVPTFTYVGFGVAIVALVLAQAWGLAVRRRDAAIASTPATGDPT